MTFFFPKNKKWCGLQFLVFSPEARNTYEVLVKIDQTTFMLRVMKNYCSSERIYFNPFSVFTAQSCAVSYDVTDVPSLFEVLILLTFSVFWVWVFLASDVNKHKN